MAAKVVIRNIASIIRLDGNSGTTQLAVIVAVRSKVAKLNVKYNSVASDTGVTTGVTDTSSTLTVQLPFMKFDGIVMVTKPAVSAGPDTLKVRTFETLSKAKVSIKVLSEALLLTTKL